MAMESQEMEEIKKTAVVEEKGGEIFHSQPVPRPSTEGKMQRIRAKDRFQSNRIGVSRKVQLKTACFLAATVGF